MTTAYFYAAIQCADHRAFGEVRTVGTVFVAPDAGFSAVVAIPLERKLAETTIPVVRQVLRLWEDQARELTTASPTTILDWMKSRAVGTEDVVRLSQPALGLTEDPERELKRLKAELTGYRPLVVPSHTTKVVSGVLKAHHLSARFRDATLPAGPASYRFPWVDGSRVLHPVELDQKKPGAVLDAAWRDVGRFQEIRHHMPALDVLIVTPSPGALVIERAHDVYREAHLHLVYPEPRQIEAGLQRWGLIEA